MAFSKDFLITHAGAWQSTKPILIDFFDGWSQNQPPCVHGSAATCRNLRILQCLAMAAELELAL